MSDAIQGAIAELRAQRANIDRAIETLERLVSDAPKPTRAKKSPEPAALGRPAKTGDGERKRPVFRKHCDTCGAHYIGAGPRTPCPQCHPKTVTPAQWAERQERAAKKKAAAK